MKRGYSIMEVLVAVAILSIALPGLVRWVTSSRKTQNNSYRSERATEFAQYVLDSLREMPRATRSVATTPVTRTRGPATYQVTWDYVNSSNPYGGLQPGAVWVNVQWTAGRATRTSRLDGVLP